MNIEKSCASRYVFEQKNLESVGGIPITDLITLEQKKSDLITGGCSDQYDKYSRLSGLVVPTGLFVRQTIDDTAHKITGQFRSPLQKDDVVPSDVFDKLFDAVATSKSSYRNGTTQKRGRRDRQKNTRRVM